MKLDLIRNFLPVLVLFLFVVYTKAFICIGNTYLGKCIAIMLILLYSTVDIAYGVLVCLLVVFFYQATNLYGQEGFVPLMPADVEGGITPEIRQLSFAFTPDDDPMNSAPESDQMLASTNQLVKILKSLQTSKDIASINNTVVTEPFTAGDFAPNSEDVAVFQNQHCVNDKLMYKEFAIKQEMSQHVFPEIEYSNKDNICNLCDPNCQFTVNRIMTEQRLVRDSTIPKQTTSFLE